MELTKSMPLERGFHENGCCQPSFCSCLPSFLYGLSKRLCGEATKGLPVSTESDSDESLINDDRLC